MARRKSLRSAWWGVVVLFLVHGMVVSTWISRIPAVKALLHLDNATLGLTLLSPAIGAVTTIPITGMLITRFGSRRVAIWSGVLFCLSLMLPGIAVNAITLAAGLLVVGIAGAAMDVSMNAQGVEVEKAFAKPTMSRFHGMFSLGAMTGAAVGGLAAAYGVGPIAHFSASGLCNLVPIAAVAPLLLDATHGDAAAQHRLPFRKIPRMLLAISVIGFCILLSEGAISDWTAVYMKQILDAGQGMAAAGFAAFSAAMALFRFLGDIITSFLGPYRTVRNGCLVAASGMSWALLMRSPGWALPGFAVAGVGLSVVIPLVFGSGGKIRSISPGAGIATVTGIGYIGFIVGPPLIGFTSQVVTLRYALFVIVACCLISAVLSRDMKELGIDSIQEPAHGEPI